MNELVLRIELLGCLGIPLENSLIPSSNFSKKWIGFILTTSIVSLSLFYKDLKNHIEAGFGSAGVTWNNVESSSVRGLEIEAKKKITKNFEIKLNYTYVKSISEFVRKNSLDPELSKVLE